MPRAQQTELSLFSLSPIAVGSQYTTEFAASDFDHLLFIIDFTKASLTSIDLYPQVSLDGSTWYDYYDCNASQVTWNFTADASYARMLGQANNVTRLQPLPIMAPLARIGCDGNGTATGSSLTLKAVPFNMGAIHDA